MIPHHDPIQQPDSSPREPALPGDISQTAPPDNTASSGGTDVPQLPVPSTVIIHLLGPDDPDPWAVKAEAQPPETAVGSSPVPPPQTCPTCGRAYDLFDHDTSRLLDWIERLQQDVHHLKATVEEVLP